MSSRLNDLLQAHTAVMALLDSSVISISTKMQQLIPLGDKLEREITQIKDKETEKLAAD